ncbi:LysR family transcriptional regulator [Rodentibacter caecimuris]|uniref:LysR family transcriptional regulator n=1 Tax=Rodentibacter caecimuris TaxID=1796644 RepID=UPI001B314D7B|nr:LysR family transcriptional regulator [Pasteurella caecimuris]MCR1838344.1 LysR family transcriptional regulator [Pasteurella caecimuris]MCU0107545.1 LysR family transcriptional regulator [Pasteurella caecimuris]
MALDKLEVMRAFCRIVETGNFKNASEDLNIATTTLSGQIQSLENHLGIKLLHRTTRRVSPTADGLQYYQRILPLLDEIEEINREIQQQNHISGLLKVEMPSPIADHLIVPNLPSFLQKYPNLRFEIGSSERVVDLINEGVDCAIRGGVITDDSLVVKMIGQMPFCLCATPDYLRQHMPITNAEDLEQHSYLAFKFAATGKVAKVYVAAEVINQVKDDMLFHKTPDQTYNNAQTYYRALLAGLGIGYAPKAFAAPYLASGELVEILKDYPLQAMPLSFVYPYSRYTPKRVKIFLEWVEELIERHSVWQKEK